MTSADASSLWRKVRPDAQGLVPCVVQDVRSHAVLMVAWVSEAALDHSLSTGWATFWSRSRSELWEKGATSGTRQRLVEARLDCDGDTLLYRVDPKGPACHQGHDSCFFRRQVGSGWRFDPEQVLGEPTGRSEAFRDLEALMNAQAAAARGSPDSPDAILVRRRAPRAGRAFEDPVRGAGPQPDVRQEGRDAPRGLAPDVSAGADAAHPGSDAPGCVFRADVAGLGRRSAGSLTRGRSKRPIRGFVRRSVLERAFALTVDAPSFKSGGSERDAPSSSGGR